MKDKSSLPDIDVILVTQGEAARLLSISVTEIDNLRRAGRIVARKYGQKVLIPIVELRRFAENLPSDEIQ